MWYVLEWKLVFLSILTEGTVEVPGGTLSGVSLKT